MIPKEKEKDFHNIRQIIRDYYEGRINITDSFLKIDKYYNDLFEEIIETEQDKRFS